MVNFAAAFCLDGQTESRVEFMNGRQNKGRFVTESFEDEWKRFGFPDIRGLGWTGELESTTFKEFLKWERLAMAGHHFIELSSSTDNLLKIRKFSASDPDDAMFYNDFDVDPNTNMILKSKSYRQNYKKKGQRAGVTDLFKTQWVETSGVQVPSKINISGIDSRRISKRDSQWGQVRKEYTFYWFSVNEPIEAAAFDGSEIADEESMLRLVDPIGNEAIPLIEFLEREQPAQPVDLDSRKK